MFLLYIHAFFICKIDKINSKRNGLNKEQNDSVSNETEYDITHHNYIKFAIKSKHGFPPHSWHTLPAIDRVSRAVHRNTSKPLERISVGLSIATYIFHLCNVRKLSNDFFQFLFYHDASFSRTLHKSNSFLDIGKIRRIIIYELAVGPRLLNHNSCLLWITK